MHRWWSVGKWVWFPAHRNYIYLIVFIFYRIISLQWHFASIALHLGMDLSVCDIWEWRAFSISSVCIGADRIARCSELDKRVVREIATLLFQMVHGRGKVFEFGGSSIPINCIKKITILTILFRFRVQNFQLSQITLLAACLNAINIPERFGDFLHIYLGKFLGSTTYSALCQSLS